MNEELVRELAYNTKLKTGAPLGNEKWQNIFAELIVRECAKVLWDSNDILGEYRIKKHFGIEE